MKSIILLAGSLLCFSLHALAQNSGDDFESFSRTSDSVLHAAYEKRDAKLYEQQLQLFLSRYDKLNAKDKKKHAGRLSEAYYNLSCTYALLSNRQQALANLEKAIQAGFYDYSHMQNDTDLDNIRNEKKYSELMTIVRPIGDYPYILRNAAKYNTADNREFPAFTYQPANDTDLVSLRQAFDLDSIAGKGNEVSKIINLMHWIHNYIPHDGEHPNPVAYSAQNLVAACKKDDRGLNCRGLATVLNECYLAMGFPSRLVTCLPKDSLGTDQDCHVINIVYSRQLKKWLWMDPTNDAYLMNEKGELLSIEEVRRRFINNETLILNPDANWNRRSSTTAGYYLGYYMAKNMYRFECPVNSCHNLEAGAEGKKLVYVELLPLDYFEQKPDVTETTNKRNKTTFVRYKTNNPDKFWQAPE